MWGGGRTCGRSHHRGGVAGDHPKWSKRETTVAAGYHPEWYKSGIPGKKRYKSGTTAVASYISGRRAEGLQPLEWRRRAKTLLQAPRPSWSSRPPRAGRRIGARAGPTSTEGEKRPSKSTEMTLLQSLATEQALPLRRQERASDVRFVDLRCCCSLATHRWTAMADAGRRPLLDGGLLGVPRVRPFTTPFMRAPSHRPAEGKRGTLWYLS